MKTRSTFAIASSCPICVRVRNENARKQVAWRKVILPVSTIAMVMERARTECVIAIRNGRADTATYCAVAAPRIVPEIIVVVMGSVSTDHVSVRPTSRGQIAPRHSAQRIAADAVCALTESVIARRTRKGCFMAGVRVNSCCARMIAISAAVATMPLVRVTLVSVALHVRLMGLDMFGVSTSLKCNTTVVLNSDECYRPHSI